MERHRFPNCCGATILTNFGHAGAHGGSEQTPLEEIELFLNTKVDLRDKTAPLSSQWIFNDMRHNAFHMAVLNEKQHEALHGTFVKCGFKVVAVNNNGHTSSDNYLYVRKNNH